MEDNLENIIKEIINQFKNEIQELKENIKDKFNKIEEGLKILNDIQVKMNILINTKELLDNINYEEEKKEIEININNINKKIADTEINTAIKNKIGITDNIINIDEIDNKILELGFTGVNITVVDENTNYDEQYIINELMNQVENLDITTNENKDERKMKNKVLIKDDLDMQNITDNDEDDFNPDDSYDDE